jgi:uncharacterized protein YjbJ (UPF0337 family)
MITWKEIETNWTQFKPKIRTQWNKLTESDVARIHGNKAVLLEELETRYHYTRTDAQKQLDDFLKTQTNPIAKK